MSIGIHFDDDEYRDCWPEVVEKDPEEVYAVYDTRNNHKLVGIISLSMYTRNQDELEYKGFECEKMKYNSLPFRSK